MAMTLEVMALPASFCDSGMEGVRMVSTFFARAPLVRRVQEVRNMTEAKTLFDSVAEEAKMLNVSFSCRTRHIGGRAVNGWSKVRFAYDHDVESKETV